MKDWIDLDAQLKRHVARGLDMEGTTEREFKLFLYSSNYYRVSGYGRCFYEPGTDRYAVGTTASQIMDVYDLDRREIGRASCREGESISVGGGCVDEKGRRRRL